MEKNISTRFQEPVRSWVSPPLSGAAAASSSGAHEILVILADGPAAVAASDVDGALAADLAWRVEDDLAAAAAWLSSSSLPHPLSWP